MVVYCGRICALQHQDIWGLAALSIAQPPSILSKALKQSSSVSLCVPASQIRRNKINEVAEAVAYLFFRFLCVILILDRKAAF